MNLCDEKNQIVDDQSLDLSKHVQIINSNPKSSWKAATSDRLNGMTRSQIKAMMGTVVDPDWSVSIPDNETLNFSDQTSAALSTLPSKFTVGVDKWQSCNKLVTTSRDQSNCGSCWAQATTAAFNDRLCIANGFDKLLSTADTTGCCKLSS